MWTAADCAPRVCSRPGAATLPIPFGAKVRAQVELSLRENLVDIDAVMRVLASGRCDSNPFPDEAVSSLRCGLEAICGGTFQD